jgi:SAM-dependent methyltransferase
MTTETHICACCAARALIEVDGYAALPRVTSDCRPWAAGGLLAVCASCGAIQKVPSQAWHDEARDIYKDYNLYDLAGGKEPAAFQADGATAPRSSSLSALLVRELDARGDLLDIGSGNGAVLSNIAGAIPQWRVNAYDLSDASLPALRKIGNFVRLFSEPLEDIDERFDAITMIHSLEHIPSPERTLVNIRGLLRDRGCLVIQVPDAAASPFDLLVADHLVHFTPAHVALVAARAGFAEVMLRNDVVPKEVSFIGRPGSDIALPEIDPQVGLDIARKHVGFLRDLVDSAAEAAVAARRKKQPFGLFGTAVAGVWLYGALRESVDFFVDEDPQRQGARLDGKPILSPGNVSGDAVIYTPLAAASLAGLKPRLAGYPGHYLFPADQGLPS